MDLALEIATPERLVVREQVTEVLIPGRAGYFGVLPGHAPLLSELASGVLTYVAHGAPQVLAILGGFVEVLPDRVRVFADAARRREEIDAAAAKQELDRAQAALPTAADAGAAMAEVERAQALVNAAASVTA